MLETNNHLLLREKCEQGVFEHYISLGHCCYVAMDLEKMALRDASMSFDWNRTRWKAIERSFRTHFAGYLDYNELYQKKSAPHVYKNLDCGVGFVHDFVAYKSLRSQIRGVQKKYDRRVERFFECISEPTLFIRYCWDKEELIYIADSYSEIEGLIKQFNEANEIVIITHDEVDDIIASRISFLFHIDKKENEELNQSPIFGSAELYDILNNAVYDKRETNQEFEKAKRVSKRQSLLKRIQKKINKLRTKRVYTHSLQC